jgi:hypothetical protein
MNHVVDCISDREVYERISTISSILIYTNSIKMQELSETFRLWNDVQPEVSAYAGASSISWRSTQSVELDARTSTERNSGLVPIKR